MVLKLLIYSLLFFLPTQLGKHFWFDFSYKLGVRVDYLSPTIYFTDIIVFLIVIIFFLTKKIRLNGKLLKWLIGLMIFVGYWILIIKESPYLLAYNLLKLAEMVALALIIAKTVGRRDFPQVIKILNLSLVVQVCLAGYQVVVEKSSSLWIIGERTFSIQTPGIAKFQALSGHLLLRGYATFPHPNVLAGFCLLLLAANLVMLKQQKKQFPWWLLGIIFSLAGIFLSFSLLSWVLGTIIIVYVLFPKKPILVILLFIILNSYFIIQIASESVSRRWQLMDISWQLFKTSPIFGIGLGDFIPKMPALALGSTYFWQPVHNIFALIAVESGILGLGVLGWLIIRFKIYNLRFKNKIILIWWLIIIITGLFDHYWLTLQQGRLLLALIIGLSLI